MKRAFTRTPSTRISRLLILTMVLALLVTCFAGCKKQDPKPSDDDQTPPGLMTGETNKPAETPTDSADQTDPTGTEPVADPNILTVTADQINIRSAPSAESTVIGQLVKGDQVEIVDQQTLLGVTWGRLANNKGWICMDLNTVSMPGGYVEPTDPTEPDESTPEETKPEESKPNTGNTSTGNGSKDVIAKGVVTASELNIRSKASTDGEIVGKLTTGDRVEILEKSGNWGRTSKGWISLDYVYQDGTAGKNTAKGVVIGTQLNVRSGPGTDYGQVASLSFGDRVNILEQFTINGTKWGCIDKGWIALQYVYIDGTTGEHSGTGTINVTDQLNIRSGPGTNYALAGTLKGGTKVTILTQIKIGETTWGCIDKGWISMDYVEMD